MIAWFTKKTTPITIWITLYGLTEGVIRTTVVDQGNGTFKWSPRGRVETFIRAEDEGIWWFRSEIEAMDELIRLKAEACRPLEEQIVKIKRIPLTPVEWETDNAGI